jgi:hypothetical protein
LSGLRLKDCTATEEALQLLLRPLSAQLDDHSFVPQCVVLLPHNSGIACVPSIRDSTSVRGSQDGVL